MNKPAPKIYCTTNWASYSNNVSDLLDQIPQEEQFDSIYADGAYDTKHCRQVIPPRKNAKLWKDSKASAIERNELLKTVKHLDRTVWKKRSGYQRSKLSISGEIMT